MISQDDIDAMGDVELVPCPNPWCGSHDGDSEEGPWMQVFNDTAPDVQVDCIVRCSGCGINTGIFTRSKDEAAKMWNTRATVQSNTDKL